MIMIEVDRANYSQAKLNHDLIVSIIVKITGTRSAVGSFTVHSSFRKAMRDVGPNRQQGREVKW